MKRVELGGRKFGRLTVLECVGIIGTKIHWECLCECGTRKNIASHSLTTGHTTSCGCKAVDMARVKNLSHGHGSRMKGETREYRAWLNMRTRCLNPRNARYKYYGGRGITICKEWDSYGVFLADMGQCPPGFTIDRIDNSKGYCPDNCEWKPWVDQANNKRNNLLLEAFGKTQTVAQWARDAGVSYINLRYRLKKHGAGAAIDYLQSLGYGRR